MACLTGCIEIDDTYLGDAHPARPGADRRTKMPFVADIQNRLDGKPQKVRFRAMRFTRDGHPGPDPSRH